MATPQGNHGRKGKEGQEETLLDYAPHSITIDEYVESRAREVMFMVKKYRTVTSNKNPTQNLPRHMRRRAASYNVKRLPRRVREQALLNKNGPGAPVKTKRPSRKHRRKPSNLLTEYVRRQKRCVWLETHLWHAKRFHMIEKWGYKIPLHLNDKSTRASYRANNHFCIMQDISHWCCIEVRGPQDSIVSALNRMTSKEVGPSVEAATYLSGTREGKVILYHLDSYPKCAIGPARYLWCPEMQEGQVMKSQLLKQHPERLRKMWLWVHPSCHDTVLGQLQKALEFPEDSDKTLDGTTDGKVVSGENVPDMEKQMLLSNEESCGKSMKRKAEDTDNTMTKSKRQKTEISVDPRTVTLPLVAHYKHGEKEIISLKDNLVRFKLSGPLTNTVLTDLLKPAKTVPKVEGSKEKWWSRYYCDKAGHDIYNEQSSIWQKISTIQAPGELPSSCVLGLTVRDPRILLPKVKTKVAQNINDVAESVADICKNWPPNACSSPLWDMKNRDEVKTNKMPDAKMNNLRSQQLVPGSDLDLGDEESRVPVILIQSPGCQPTSEIVKESAETGTRHSPGWGSGWDVILPSGWAMPFWVGLVYRGARTGGVREEEHLSQEMGMPCFPNDFPDTTAGEQSEATSRTEMESKYNRIPPAKRSNFTKIGTVAPFHCPWSQLIQDWNDSNEEVPQICVLRNRKLLHLLHRMCLPQLEASTRDEVLNTSIPASAIVPVQVTDLSKGTPKSFSMICLPSTEDLQNLMDNKFYGGPSEKLHKDSTESKTEENGNKKAKQKKFQMEFPVKTVRQSCNREIIGYVNRGGFCLSSGRGAGMGFVAATGLCQLLKETLHNSQTVVLVRAPHSLQYRFAYLSVNLMH